MSQFPNFIVLNWYTRSFLNQTYQTRVRVFALHTWVGCLPCTHDRYSLDNNRAKSGLPKKWYYSISYEKYKWGSYIKDREKRKVISVCSKMCWTSGEKKRKRKRGGYRRKILCLYHNSRKSSKWESSISHKNGPKLVTSAMQFVTFIASQDKWNFSVDMVAVQLGCESTDSLIPERRTNLKTHSLSSADI